RTCQPRTSRRRMVAMPRLSPARQRQRLLARWPRTRPARLPPQRLPPLPPPAPRGSGKFLWPVNGKVVSVFGLKDGGQHNDGINIAAPLGTPVRAAENGVVV